MLWNLIYQYVRAYLIGVAVGWIIIGLIFAFVCYKIVQGKGYSEETCFYNAIGGFFLTLIWLIVVVCKQNAPAEAQMSDRRSDGVVSVGISQPAFIATLTLALAICVAGLFVLLKFSWWGLAIVGVGLVIFAMLYNKA